ncbi:hypothetical protein BKN38_00105 [Helicobacter sp. CLO-3]|uniref:UDP-N-acetylglucosamine--N-acetylmuramyl- (pentapeptide) pyrophosphoryl-undecaprenol N-acetylglucosamine transferase n=1 Tax=unclassified Helicobacter TaxID=2593540 RepID=UPI000805B743|nr:MULTISPECIES: UDP-N-acetylglucosamine--N-acetylmuramyl-(pentapeptide) pyrophosphoryl-undecaprenol N-acetylglucosamine transferase [unclassified Helicobacter]OBV28778.1 hypothetical protein BA723_01505 [Helicobacter sp. CLO-3]OHU85848.1 hypothetical protein BKN38_00105 [Helicobacter sp. CLO-3]
MIVITGGGTGGHLSIAQSLGEELRKRGKKAVYIGSLSGQDRAWFGDAGADSRAEFSLDSVDSDAGVKSGAESSAQNSTNAGSTNAESTNADSADTNSTALFEACYFLPTSGVVNKRGLSKLASIFAQLSALQKVREIFKRHKVRAVISVGGFSAGPASIGAIVFRKPLFIHEQNATMGRLNELLAPFAKRVFSAFKEPFTPYPIKQEALQKRRIRNKLESIIFIGGSQGAKAINDVALALAPTLLSRGISITHQCGARDLARVREAYQKLGLLDKITLFDFSKELISYLVRADVCVARAGASSVWENAALAIPTLYIPYPHAAKNHQASNAQFFVSRGAGAMILERDLQSSLQGDLQKDLSADSGALESSKMDSADSAKLDSTKNPVLDFIDSCTPSMLESTSQALASMININGASVIIDEVLSYLGASQN